METKGFASFCKTFSTEMKDQRRVRWAKLPRYDKVFHFCDKDYQGSFVHLYNDINFVYGKPI
jgi:hypothetical protein